MKGISELLQDPMQHQGWLRTVAIGGILTFFGFLVFPLFIVYGYSARVIEQNLAGDEQPPTFRDWVDMLMTGIKIFAIGIVYLIVPAIVAAVTIGGSIVTIAYRDA